MTIEKAESIKRELVAEVIIFVRQGIVESVYSNANVMVTVADYGSDYVNPEHDEDLDEAEKRAQQPDMRDYLF